MRLVNCTLDGTTSNYPLFSATNAVTWTKLTVDACDFLRATSPLISANITVTNPMIRNTQGYNPVGAVNVAVPASGTVVAAQSYDRTFYVAAGASTCTMAILGGPSPVIPSGGFGSIRVPAGQTVTPTYDSAPTWVVEGE